MSGNLSILITGAAGFIGFHLANSLSGKGHCITGIDNLNDYYDPCLKISRLDILRRHSNFTFRQIDICDKKELDKLFEESHFDIVINLAAQAGVRYSIEQPYKYIDSNLIGFINVLEACRNFPVKHLLFASSSSVYGNSDTIPFCVDHKTDKPVSLYAATKKANELMAHSYAHLYNIPITGLRFFTVYGPMGRPDMAYSNFTKNILEERPIRLFNNGKMRRDFTYVDDVVKGITVLMDLLTTQELKWPGDEAPIRIFNIGNNQPVELLEFVNVLEETIGKKACIEMWPMQDGDVLETCADIEPLRELTGFMPSTNIKEGLRKFVSWYKSYYYAAPALVNNNSFVISE